MAKTHTVILPLLFLLLSRCPSVSASASPGKLQAHVVYFGEHKGDQARQEIEAAHHSYLLSVKTTEEEARSSLIYSYKHSINGFAAMLTPEEAQNLSMREEVTSVIPSRPGDYSLHTTRSWQFAGLTEDHHHGSNAGILERNGEEDVLLKARYGQDVIVGVLDNGIWPESESFADEGLGPVPATWKGICESGDGFNASHCNRKLIGARFYLKGYEATFGPLNGTLDPRSPRDVDGHGTHTASTVAGRRVPHASSLGGFAAGTATGGAALARLAIYKVCWAPPGKSKVDENTCLMEDMLAAIDDAIADGVHVLSMSIGTVKPFPYTKDGIALGSLHAVKHNIVVACSAGNSGPTPATLSNPAPWIITVGASSVDRIFPAPVLLGNGMEISGQTVTPSKPGRRKRRLVFAGDVVSSHVPKTYIAGQCLPGSLSSRKTRGKIVACLRGNGTRVGKGFEAKRAGAAGFILGNAPANGKEVPVDAHVLPATAVDSNDAVKILAYINSTKNATATIFPAKTMLHTKAAPFMAAFTSRGPNLIDSHILKPDVTAPGLNILAAWTGADAPSKLECDHRVAKYNIMSGTSMSCPHVAAAAALLRAIHPEWSSAAIRSAIMTTATLRNNEGLPLQGASGSPADPFQYGAGHFRPAAAADPGLVYDATYTDYLLYLCGVGVNKVEPSFRCPDGKSGGVKSLNYPSVAIPKMNETAVVKRSVTNVGGGRSVYVSSVKPPPGFSVKISPSVLAFRRVGETKRFTIRVEATGKIRSGEHAFGWFSWSDRTHEVRSPMVVSTAEN